MRRHKRITIVEEKDLTRVPALYWLKPFFSYKWFVIDYDRERDKEISDWIDKVITLVNMNRIMSQYIVVLADWGQFKDYEVPHLIGRYAELGASFMDYDDESEPRPQTFEEACEVLDQKLDEDHRFSEQYEKK